jgi:hypothetical protein
MSHDHLISASLNRITSPISSIPGAYREARSAPPLDCKYRRACYDCRTTVVAFCAIKLRRIHGQCPGQRPADRRWYIYGIKGCWNPFQDNEKAYTRCNGSKFWPDTSFPAGERKKRQEENDRFPSSRERLLVLFYNYQAGRTRGKSEPRKTNFGPATSIFGHYGTGITDAPLLTCFEHIALTTTTSITTKLGFLKIIPKHIFQ